MADKCGVDPRENIIGFLQWILAPVALARAMIYLLYKAPEHYQVFLSFQFAIEVYYYATFGSWTLENFYKMIQAPSACGRVQVSLIKLVYHITLIVGAFPAVLVVLGVIFFACLIPYCFYDKYQKARAERESQRKAKEMLNAMFKVKWDSSVLTY